jgi:hypothetical protein
MAGQHDPRDALEPPGARRGGAWAPRAGAPALAFSLALLAYALAAGPALLRPSVAPHYAFLAEAFLHGRLDVVGLPHPSDVIVRDGRIFVAGSPLPALLMAPAVAVWGAGVSDVAFGAVIGALAAAVVQATFRSAWTTLLFALGTPQLYLSALGSVWFNAHVVAVLFALLAVREALGRRRWLLAGALLSLAGLARPTLMFGAPCFAVLILLGCERRQWRRALAALGGGLALGIAAHAAYNAARFGSAADFGYGSLRGGTPNMVAAHARWGAFHPHFLPCNLYVSLAGPPRVKGHPPRLHYRLCDHLLRGVRLPPPAARVEPNPLGMSLFLATPAFLLLPAALRRRDPGALSAWAGLLAVMTPLWMYHNTGSVQFGYRYWMDAAPFWLLLLAPVVDARSRRLRWGARLLVLASLAIHAWGFAWLRGLFVR